MILLKTVWTRLANTVETVKMEIKTYLWFLLLLKVEAEAVPEVSEKYEITSVPTFLFFKVSLFSFAYLHMTDCR